MSNFTNIGSCEEGYTIGNCTDCGSNGVLVHEHACDSNDYGDFHGCNVNFSTEYHEARKLMGLTTTNMDDLFDKVTLLYLNAPEKWREHYLNLIWEIETRQNMLTNMRLGLI